MRLAFVGKGGSGKSMIAGTLARLLAAEGTAVLAVDSDPLPGLAWSIGLDSTDAGLPDELTEENLDSEGPRWRLRDDLQPDEMIERAAIRGPDGVRFLQIGKPRGPVGALARSQVGFRQLLPRLDARWTIVADLPAGTRQAFLGWAAYADTVVIVCDPTVASMLTARRLTRLGTGDDPPRLVAVASRVRDASDADTIAHSTGLEVVATVPEDEAVRRAEAARVAPCDGAADSVAVQAVASFAQALRTEEPSS